ncbi:hypothetical protein FH972_007262 [Carpinus fangiana]|uniref:DUF7950 domain-containing protein n=1 Tax=Carpinus fangiana TaxID=176857 RepID=A0A5N6QVV3_9ROSI|nr:hypothetical protein FH972_007262 [Carpinus fangiana]
MIRCGGGVQDNAIINRMMLRFRPIAPKPATWGSGTGGPAVDSKNAFVTKGRAKRKYVRVRKNSGYRRKKRKAEEETKKMMEKKDGLEKRVKTLQLLPEKSERSESPESESWCNFDRTVIRKDSQENGDPPMWLNFDKGEWKDRDRTVVAAGPMISAVESWVTVESVTDKCMASMGVPLPWLGSTDVERMSNLEHDTCPGFVSDSSNRVLWVNGAFKRMVRQQNDGQSQEIIRVWLVAKEKLPYSYTAFSCQVKLQYWLGKDKCSQIVPCDVWRMDGGGFSWRLDVEATLSLGR